MSLKSLRILTVLISLIVLVIVGSFVGSLYTGVQKAKKKHEPQPLSVPKPALPSGS